MGQKLCVDGGNRKISLIYISHEDTAREYITSTGQYNVKETTTRVQEDVCVFFFSLSLSARRLLHESMWKEWEKGEKVLRRR